MVHSLLNQKTYVAAAFLPLLPIRGETRGQFGCYLHNTGFPESALFRLQMVLQ